MKEELRNQSGQRHGVLLAALQGWRGVFALGIFFHHLGLFAAAGDAGVSFFIMLSGFVMSAGYESRFIDGHLSHRSFMRRRFLRLYPLHIVGFIAGILLMYSFAGAQTPLVWGCNLLMLQSWIPIKVYYFSCDAPSWCLSDLFFCYALFPWLLKLIFGLRRSVIAMLSVLLLGLYAVGVNLLPERWWNGLIYINPLFRLVDFVLGMLLRRFVSGRMSRGVTSTAAASGIEFAVICFYVTFLIYYPYVSARYSLASYWWAPNAVLLVTFAGGRGGVVSRLLSSGAFVWFGALSFAFYMLHMPLIYGYMRLCRICGVDPWAIAHVPAVLILLVVTTEMAVFTQRHIEPHIARMLSRMLPR